MKALLSAVISIAVLTLGVSVASGIPTRTFKTHVVVEEASRLASGAIDVTGTLTAKDRTCAAFRTVALMERRAKDRPRLLAYAITGSPTGVWRLQTKPSVEVEGALFAKAEQQNIQISTASTSPKRHDRRVVCKAARVPVKLAPPPAPPAP